MRKILTFHRNGIAAVKRAVRSAKQLAIGASLAVTFCTASTSHAQTLAQYLAPTASSVEGGPVTTAVAQNFEDLPTVDASYSLVGDQSKVVPAQFSAFGPSVNANPCNPGCDVSWYFGAEVLAFRRENDEFFSLSRNVFMPDWDYELGSRITVGRLFDCTNGYEFVYTGPFEWSRGVGLTNPGAMQSQFVPLLGYTLAQVSAFNNADTHIQAHQANMEGSFEVNRKWWVWDVVSTAVGFRYIDYDEQYAFFSSNGGVGTGLYQDSVENKLVGLQVGADIAYPLSLRGNVGVKGKAGVYANIMDRRTRLVNAGTVVVNAGADETEIAGQFEFGVFGNWAFVPSIRLTAGYDFWIMPGIATIADQRAQLVTPASGSSIRNEDTLFLHGGSMGLQILF